jgi:hypothetical protein
MQNSGHCDKAGAGGYNETTFVQTMDALKTTGLDKLGYIYLVRHTPTKGPLLFLQSGALQLVDLLMMHISLSPSVRTCG